MESHQPTANFKQSLPALARRLLDDGPHKTHTANARRIRIQLGSEYVADSTKGLFVWEHPFYPFFYIPADDFVKSKDVSITKIQDIKDKDDKTGAHQWQIKTGSKTTDRILEFVSGPLSGLVRFEFEAAGMRLDHFISYPLIPIV